MPDLRINATLLQARIDALGAIGAHPDGGLYRGLYHDSWAEAMELLAGWMRAQGLAVRRDAVGNLWGRLEGSEGGPAIVTGSHVDTVKQGGQYDGALGVHAALEAVRALAEAAGRPRRPLEVLVICEEEGSRFPSDFWGARAICGLLEPGEASTLRDEHGVLLADEMRRHGLDPARTAEARRDDIGAFVELHIEQGRILETEGYPLGVVHTITGLRHQRVTVRGRQDHAGTTPMDLRLDPMAGAAEMIYRLTGVAAEMGRPAVATVGIVGARPGNVNIVPNSATFTIDARHSDPAARLELNARIDAVLHDVARARGLQLEVEVLVDHEPTPMHLRLRRTG